MIFHIDLFLTVCQRTLVLEYCSTFHRGAIVLRSFLLLRSSVHVASCEGSKPTCSTRIYMSQSPLVFIYSSELGLLAANEVLLEQSIRLAQVSYE